MNTEHRFINLKTGETIEITGTDAEISKIVTITVTGARVRPRAVKTASLKTSYTNRSGQPWKAAYVAIDALPDDHPLRPAVQPEAPVRSAEPVETSTPALVDMSDDELTAYANTKRAERNLADYFLTEAKKELHRRYRATGAYLRGDVYMEITTNNRFDASLAKKVLTSQEYAAILKPKPDASLAKEILTEERYKQVCKAFDNKMEIRTATEEDRMRLREREEIEAAKAEIDESFYPDVVTPF